MNFGQDRVRGPQTVWLVLAGLAQSAAIAMPGSGQAHGWLQVLSLTLLASALVRTAKSAHSEQGAAKTAAWTGGLFATTWLASSFWWLYVSMH